MPRLFRFLLAAAAAALLLAGCASTYLLDNQVQSFSQLQGLPAQPTYRFERTLSQEVDPTQQALEALADPALYKAGLRRDDAAPRYTVQVFARTERTLSPYADPYWGPWGWGGGWGVGLGGRHFGLGIGGPFPRADSYWFHREVSVVVRDLGSNRVVYETHAVNDGPWLDNRSVLPAMFDAAMQGFPNPPAGPRRVDIQVGRNS
jgi:outer membrane murein-binding lipoprotein Lpp